MSERPEFKKIEKVKEPEEREEERKIEEKEELSETINEELDFRTASFVKEHLDLTNLFDFNFDPEEELADIRNMKSSLSRGKQSPQRMFSVENFRSKLKTFRINLAKWQWELENFIRQNPDSSLEELEKRADQITSNLHLVSQKKHFLAAIKKYFNAHQEITEQVNKFKKEFGEKWPEQLFAALFGRLPHGQIKIEIMPMAIYFKIYDIADYIQAHGKDESVARASGGAMLGREMPIAAFSSKTLIENSGVVEKTYGDQVKRVAIHEEEHAIHKLYPTESFVREESRVLNFFKKNGQISMPSFQESLTHLARWQIGGWQKRAKTEVLAFLKEGVSGTAILNVLLEEDSEALYYFLRNSRSDTSIADAVVQHFRRMNPHVTYEDGQVLSEDEVRRLATEAVVKGWDIYKDSLRTALETANWLLEKYGREQTIRILAQEPISKWHRLRRILS